MRILLVDDEEELVSALAERLSLRDIEADGATSAAEAVVLAKKNAYDLAVLDLKMPKVGGLELMGMLKSLQPQMRFIFFTGHGSIQDCEEVRDAGACYLMKPVKIESLLEKIHDSLRQ